MKQNIILYPPGCYGTYVEWICNYLEGTVDDIPFNKNGNSHKFKGNPLFQLDKVEQFIAAGEKIKYSRTHPWFSLAGKVEPLETLKSVTTEKTLCNELKLLNKHFDKILILAIDEQSTLTVENNQFVKILVDAEYKPFGEGEADRAIEPLRIKDMTLRIKSIINYENWFRSHLTKDNLLGWGKSSIEDFEKWELREFLSLMWFQVSKIQTDFWMNYHNQKRNNESFIFASEFRNNFPEILYKIIDHFEINCKPSKIKEIHSIHEQWLSLQTQIDKDALVSKIINSIIDNDVLDWGNTQLSLIDEAFIQKSLRDNGIELKCYKLNEFPTNSKDFQALIIKI